MMLSTTSEVISLSEKLENESAVFYERISQRFEENREVLYSFIDENRKNFEQIKRIYYGSITDAIEGCFGFSLESKNYVINFSLPEDITYLDALNKALDVEITIKNFYEDSAKQTKSLMSDVARVFMGIAKKRGNRITEIKDLIV